MTTPVPAAAPRALDHVVMPVDTLVEARGLFERLGFTVAPDARHPFGTENACVFFADGTYLEPLAVGDMALCGQAAEAGNPFVLRDRLFRQAAAVPGISGFALKSPDMRADRAAWERLGVSQGDMLSFSRPFRKPDGEATEVGFRLTFAGRAHWARIVLFAVEPIHRFTSDRSALTRHANGVTGIARLVLAAGDLDEAFTLLEPVLRSPATVASDGATMAAANVALEIQTPEAIEARYGVHVLTGNGPQIAGLVLSVNDLDGARHVIDASASHARTDEERVVVPFGPQSFIAFEGGRS